MLSRHRQPASVQPDSGASFQRCRQNDIIETANVIRVACDPSGIPHVRFNLKISSPRCFAEEERTLSLESFKRLYPEPVLKA
jgi:hypothetical protein